MSRSVRGTEWTNPGDQGSSDLKNRLTGDVWTG